MVQRLHVLIEGRVQGVGYRYATWRQARSLGLTGWVRNLEDGHVEAEFEGAKASLDAMHDWCKIGPPAARVTHVAARWDTGEPKYTDFDCRVW